MTWNIWNIRSKTLRAIVAWLVVGVAAVLALAILPIALAWCVVAGTIYEARGFLRGLTRGWGDVPQSVWRAMTGKGVA